MIQNVNGSYTAFSPETPQFIYDSGVIDERERIIKLIEKSFGACDQLGCKDPQNCRDEIQPIIDLITGDLVFKEQA